MTAKFVIRLLLPALSRAADRPNILWITSEDNGPHLGCYGQYIAYMFQTNATKPSGPAPRVDGYVKNLLPKIISDLEEC